VFGAFGWNKLLSTENGWEYEPGVFDIRSGKARPTALAHYIKEKNNSAISSYIAEDGWWQRPHRFIYKKRSLKPVYTFKQQQSPILIIGKNGTLGKAFHRIANERCIHNILLSRSDCDLVQHQSILNTIEKYRPKAIINAAGYVRVDDAEREPDKCFADNTIAATTLSNHCKQHNIKLVNFSSDLVFDGKKKTPYTESDFIQPLNIYGQSKALAEHQVLSSNEDALIIRTSAFFSPWDQYNFAHQVISSIQQHKFFSAPDDLIVSPTYVPDLVNVSLDLLIDGETGIWHLANKGEVSWYEFACRIATEAGLTTHFIEPVSYRSLKLNASRPVYSALSSEKGNLLPSLDDAIERYIEQLQIKLLATA
jgi:dTDP-4-dehydrorhamnose reductase